MAWTTPSTRTTGTLITASIWNTDLVDDLIYLYSSLPSARVYHNANQSINNTTVTVLALNTERWDNDTIHDTSSNNSRLTCQTAGKYVIIAHMAWAVAGAGANNESRLEILLNAATIIARQSFPVATAYAAGIKVGTIYDLSVSNYVENQVYQASGGAVNVTASGNYSPEFMMHRIGG